MVIINYIKASIFEWRKRKAIAKAKSDALTYRKKFLVLVWKKRPVVAQIIQDNLPQFKILNLITPAKSLLSCKVTHS